MEYHILLEQKGSFFTQKHPHLSYKPRGLPKDIKEKSVKKRTDF